MGKTFDAIFGTEGSEKEAELKRKYTDKEIKEARAFISREPDIIGAMLAQLPPKEHRKVWEEMRLNRILREHLEELKQRKLVQKKKMRQKL